MYVVVSYGQPCVDEPWFIVYGVTIIVAATEMVAVVVVVAVTGGTSATTAGIIVAAFEIMTTAFICNST